jgi:uncharacterized protein (TIGR03083 family)
MDTEESWAVIASQRRSLADLLEGLSDEQWELPSLCDGWRVRDVAAHVSMVALPPSPAAMLGEAVRARGSFHRLNHDMAVRAARHPVVDVVEALRQHADSRRLPMVTNHRNVLFDVLVHGQDIALPLGMDRPLPTRAAVAGAERVWTMGWPFWAQRRLRGIRLVADDADWAAGSGVEATGPISALLLVLTGRPAGLPAVRGAGADEAAARLGRPPVSA